MTDKELKKLSRKELLEMLLEQSKLLDSRQAEIDSLRSELENKNILLENAGSIAEAALKISGVFEAAQRAADIYLESVRQMRESESHVDENTE